jgi:hypothetical protein
MGAKYVPPHPCVPIQLEVTILGTITGLACISLRNRSPGVDLYGGSGLPIVSRQVLVHVPVFNIKWSRWTIYSRMYRLKQRSLSSEHPSNGFRGRNTSDRQDAVVAFGG